MNNALLSYHMADRGVTNAELCRALGISRSALYRKRSGKSEFTLSEVKKIVDFLCLGDPVPVFFAR